MFNKTRLTTSIILVIFLGGCTASPKETTAKLPLVHSSLAYSLSTQDTTLSPAIEVNGTSVIIGGSRHSILSQYTSISGNSCVRFSLEPAKLEAACQINGQWNRLKPLVTDVQN